MVHGTNIGLQYIFIVDREIDYYNDILKISMDIRKKLFEKNSKSFIIFQINEFDKRFYESKHGKKYINALNKIYALNIEYDGEKYPEDFLYYDVMIYNKEKHNYHKILSFDEFNQLKNEFENLKNDSDNYFNKKTYDKIKELKNEIDIQRIFIDSKYFEQVKKIENELINIELTDEEKEIIKKIEEHSLFHFDVKWHGFEFVLENF
jgi:hypothetical protein